MSTRTPHQTTVYLAGPMRGIEEFNFPAFEAAALHLRRQGYQVFSPAEHDLESGFDPKGTLDGFNLRAALKWDLETITSCNCVVVLPGWEHSKGCAAEVATARALGIKVLSYPDLQPIPEHPVTEVVYTDKKTGGQKGVKPARFGLMPWKALTQIAEVYGFGTKKYSARNWEKGYDWEYSYSAAMRHLAAWWSGEPNDPESGLCHLAHAGFHILALLTFQETYPEGDTRRKVVLSSDAVSRIADHIDPKTEERPTEFFCETCHRQIRSGDPTEKDAHLGHYKWEIRNSDGV